MVHSSRLVFSLSFQFHFSICDLVSNENKNEKEEKIKQNKGRVPTNNIFIEMASKSIGFKINYE